MYFSFEGGMEIAAEKHGVHEMVIAFFVFKEKGEVCISVFEKHNICLFG